VAIAAESLTGVDEFTARKVISACERALQAAGVAGMIPTPLSQVADAAGIAEMLDIGDLPDEEEIPRPNWLKRVIGAYAFTEKVVFVDRQQLHGRARFTQAHETAHAILPWHNATYLFDDETIFGDTQAKLDAEANLGAGHLIFQGRRFHAEALNYDTRLASAIAMSERYGASAHATIRYFALHHGDEVGLFVCGRFPQDNGGRLPVWFAAESERFRRRFGAMSTRARAFGRHKFIDRTCEPIFSIARGALESGSVVSDEVTLTDLGGRSVRLWVDGWFNRFNVFVMLTPKRRIRRGLRVAIRTVGEP
jgi:hypothetical protein